MKTTRILKLKNISSQFKVQLDNLMQEFCAAKRYSLTDRELKRQEVKT